MRRWRKIDLTIAGMVRVSLHVQSDCPDTDFVPKLIERLPDGRAMLLMDGVVDSSGQEQGGVSARLWPTAIAWVSAGPFRADGGDQSG